MNSNHEDIDARELHEAQLTAYALGQLKAKEREAAEAVGGPLRRGAADGRGDVAALAAQVQQAYGQAPAPAASPSLREAIERQLQTSAGEEAEEAAALGKLHAAVAKAQPAAPDRLRHRWLWAVVGMAGCIAVAAALVPGPCRDVAATAKSLECCRRRRQRARTGTHRTRRRPADRATGDCRTNYRNGRLPVGRPAGRAIGSDGRHADCTPRPSRGVSTANVHVRSRRGPRQATSLRRQATRRLRIRTRNGGKE